MDWAIAFTIIGTNIALFLWATTESRADMREFRGELLGNVNSFKGEIRGWKDEIQKEMRDFHGRLCALEEKSKRVDK